MMTINGKRASAGSLTTKNVITPEGLPLTLSSASFQSSNLKLNFNLPAIDNIQFPAKIFVLFYFNNYNKSVFMIDSELEEPSPDGSYAKNIILGAALKNAIKADAKPIVYLAVAGSNTHKKKEFWTSTAAVQL